MKKFFLFTILFFLCCCKEHFYKSPYNYNSIKLYVYDKTPFDIGSFDNRIYTTHKFSTQDMNYYMDIEKYDYSLKKTFDANVKLDSILFSANYSDEDYVPKASCPAEYDKIMLFYNDSKIEYIVKFNRSCNYGFFINLESKKSYFLNYGYQDLMKEKQ